MAIGECQALWGCRLAEGEATGTEGSATRGGKILRVWLSDVTGRSDRNGGMLLCPDGFSISGAEGIGVSGFRLIRAWGGGWG